MKPALKYVSVRSNQKAFSLIEVAVGSAIITAALAGLILAFQSAVELERKNTRLVRAAFLAEEALEAARAIRTDDWNNLSSLSLNADYFLSLATGYWLLTTEPVLIDGLFERKIIFRPVNRDGNNKISETGTIDPGTLKIDVQVSWPEGGTVAQKSLITYLTNIFPNED